MAGGFRKGNEGSLTAEYTEYTERSTEGEDD